MKKLFFYSYILLIFSASAFTEESSSGDLIKKTMQADIITASYFELINWAEKLGLGTEGSKKDIEGRLFDYYGIEYGGKKSSKTSIVISSAKKMESIKIKEIDEDYIVLAGNIQLEFSDMDNNTKQVLNADRVVFNQKEKTVSASGNIVYSIEKDSSKEYFFGDKLTFNIDSFEGVFFKGISEKHTEENKEDRVFYFFGEKIYRKKGDRIILENGIISSSRDKNPNFYLSARKIWILNPGEWAMKGAVLRVGRIPVFAFPFIYMPGDKLVFHPVFGVNTKNGYFINTTTYLVGQPSVSDSQFSSFSFLQNTDSKKETLLKREGLFLRKTSIPLETKDGSYLKLISDYYTQKGYFAGLEGKMQENGSIKNINFMAGIGINRYIFSDPLYGFTPFYYDSGIFKTLMENPSIFGYELPFRFGFDISSKANIYGVNISLNLPVYSDPEFYSDIMNRKEYFDFKNIFSKNSNDTVNEESKDNLSWNLTADWRLDSKLLTPFVNSISVDKITFDVAFFSRDLQYTEVPADPIKFYYPQSIVYPDFSGKITGVIFNTEKKKNNSTDENRHELRSPWKDIPDGKRDNKDDSKILRIPDINEYEDLPYGYKYTGISQTLSYSINPKLTVNSIMNSSVPSDEDQVSTKPDYSLLSLQNITSLNYTMSISEKLLKVDSKAVLSNNYKNHFARSENFTGDWDTFILQDRNYSNYSLTNSISMLSYPLIFAEYFSLSTIKYSLNTVLFNHFYNEEDSVYKDDYISWSSDSVSNHKLSFDLIHKKSDFSKELSLTMVLPPGNTELYPSITLQNKSLTNKISTGLKEKSSGSWEIDPVSILGKYKYNDSYLSENLFLDIYDKNHISTTEINLVFFDSLIKLKEVFKGDVYNFSPISSTTIFNIWNFTSSFVAEKTEGYAFLPSSGWISNSLEQFQPSKISFGGEYSYKPDPMWKNRLKISSDINSTWSMNLLKPTDSMFSFDLAFYLDIAEFLELKFKSQSVNRAFYRYIPYSAEKIGLEETLNPITDLIKSFNFFNKNDRINSNFNLQLLEIEAVHHLGDWDLNLAYSGKPEIFTKTDSTKEYRWSGSLSIFVEWNPIPEIKKEVVISDDEIQF